MISYFLNSSNDSTEWSLWGDGPWPLMPAHAWEWRIYDPSTGRDQLFRRLPSYPILVSWDSSYSAVELILRDRIVRTPWAFSAAVDEQAALPADTCLCDFWAAGGTWHVVTQEDIPTHLPDGRAWTAQVGKRWDLDPSTKEWHVAVIDSQAGGHYGECYVTPTLREGALPAKSIPLGSLVSLMSLDPRRTRKLSEDTHGSNQAEEWIWMPSEVDSTLGLELAAGFGDSYHAFEPVEWVDRQHERRRTVYPIGTNSKVGSWQLGLGERNGKVLITSEYDGNNPRLVDLRTGKIVFQVKRGGAGAVWVPVRPRR